MTRDLTEIERARTSAYIRDLRSDLLKMQRALERNDDLSDYRARMLRGVVGEYEMEPQDIDAEIRDLKAALEGRRD